MGVHPPFAVFAGHLQKIPASAPVSLPKKKTSFSGPRGLEDNRDSRGDLGEPADSQRFRAVPIQFCTDPGLAFRFHVRVTFGKRDLWCARIRSKSAPRPPQQPQRPSTSWLKSLGARDATRPRWILCQWRSRRGPVRAVRRSPRARRLAMCWLRPSSRFHLA